MLCIVSIVFPELQVSTDYRGDASQTLTLLPLLNFFARGLDGMPEVQKEVDSLEALCCVCNCILSGKQCPESIQGLEALQERHLELFKAAYSPSDIRPKHHYGLHTMTQTQAAACVLDTWCTERKNKLFKSSLAPLVKRLFKFEQSVLVRWLEHDIESLKHTSFDVSLLAPKAACGYQCARGVQHECGKIIDGNVLLFEDGSACQVKGCIQDPVTKSIFVLAQPLELLEKGLHFTWSKWLLQERVVALTLDAALQSLRTSFYTLENDRLILLR